MEALSAPSNRISTHLNLLQTGGESRDRFRLMLVHDGYQHLDLAISELQRRAFPADTEVLLLSVADLFRTPLHLVGKDIVHSDHGEATRSHSRSRHKKTQLFFHKLESLQRQACAKVQAAFSNWDVSFEKPFDWQPNLILLAAHNRPSVKNPGIREIIRKVAAESNIPLVVARPSSQNQSTRPASLIAFDGAASVAAILKVLQSRPTDTKSDLHLMFYKDPLMTHAARWSAGYEQPDREWIDSQLVRTKTAIEALGYKVSCVTAVASAAQAIVTEAKRVDAENILLGTEPLACLGSLSTESIAVAVAAAADCSVEIAFSGEHPRPAARLQAIATRQNIAPWKGRNDSPVGLLGHELCQ